MRLGPIEDTAISIPIDGYKTGHPKNYSGGEHGVVPMQCRLWQIHTTFLLYV